MPAAALWFCCFYLWHIIAHLMSTSVSGAPVAPERCFISEAEAHCRLCHEHNTQHGYDQGACDRQILLPRRKSGHALDNGAALYEKKAHHGQCGCKPETESYHQCHSEGHPVHGYGSKQQNERRRARQKAARNTQQKQRTPGDRRTVGAGRQVGVAAGVQMTVPMMFMVVMMAVVSKAVMMMHMVVILRMMAVVVIVRMVFSVMAMVMMMTVALQAVMIIGIRVMVALGVVAVSMVVRMPACVPMAVPVIVVIT